MSLAAEYVRDRLDYDPDTGIFRWKERLVRPRYARTDNGWNTRRAGKVAAYLSVEGYLQIRLAGKLYMAHRLAWLFVYGKWPPKFLDHKNHDRADNRIENLREANDQQNARNTRLRVDNRLGRKGVQLIASSGKYRARIRQDGEQRHIGVFNTIEEASEAYARESLKVFGEFSYVGG